MKASLRYGCAAVSLVVSLVIGSAYAVESTVTNTTTTANTMQPANVNAVKRNPARICATSPLPAKCVAPCQKFNERRAKIAAAGGPKNPHPGVQKGPRQHGKLYYEIMNCTN